MAAKKASTGKRLSRVGKIASAKRTSKAVRRASIAKMKAKRKVASAAVKAAKTAARKAVVAKKAVKKAALKKVTVTKKAAPKRVVKKAVKKKVGKKPGSKSTGVITSVKKNPKNANVIITPQGGMSIAPSKQTKAEKKLQKRQSPFNPALLNQFVR